MPSKKGGYKIVSLGGLDLTGENLSLKGLYNALKLSYGKVILLCGIVINSVAKKDAYVQAEEKDGDIIIKHLYGYNLSVDDEDAITVVEDSENVDLPIPAPADDGKIVGVNVQGKYVLKPQPLPNVTAADNGKVLEVFAGAWGKGGKKVRLINASDVPNPITNYFINNYFKEGIFINGTYQGLKNPLVLPSSNEDANFYYFEVIAPSDNKDFAINELKINKTSYVITVTEWFSKSGSLATFKGKEIPLYPADTGTFTLKCVNGTLTWVQDQ